MRSEAHRDRLLGYLRDVLGGRDANRAASLRDRQLALNDNRVRAQPAPASEQ